jgi:hypothetical protein
MTIITPHIFKTQFEDLCWLLYHHEMRLRIHDTIPPLCVYDTDLTSVFLSRIGYM